MPSAIRPLLATCALAVTVAACGGTPSQVDNPTRGQPSTDSAATRNDTVHVTLGAERTLDDGRIAIRFVELVNESRCPANAMCIHQGDATVKLRVTAGTSSREAELNLNKEPKSVTFGGYAISTSELQPYPGTYDDADPRKPVPYVVLRVVRQ